MSVACWVAAFFLSGPVALALCWPLFRTSANADSVAGEQR